MSILPAIRVVFAVALLSAAPVAARERGDSSAMPLVWAPAGAAIAVSPLEAQDEGPGGHAPVVAASTCNAEINGDNITDFASVDAQAVRDALAAVAANGTVKIAGYCAGAMPQGGTTQTALITKTITLAGGYTTTDWTTYNPAGNPTTLDALLGGRVISATAAATLRGFRVTGGYISSTIEAYGGGINAAGALTLSEMIVSGNTITGAATTLNGGGAYIGGAANVSNTTFSNNVAKTVGGGASVQGAATLTGGVFQSNVARVGGGLYANATLALTGTQFLSNMAATDFGGGAIAQGAATLNGGVFQSNSAVSGGGGLVAYSTLALTGTQFLSNTTAAQSGGGAAALGAATLNGGVFQNNSAGGDGGGLIVWSTLALTGTQFLSNTAATGSGGGAVALGAATLNGGVFQSNSARIYGGGLAAFSTVALTGTRFIRNTSSAGGALYLFGSNAKRAVNALFAGNAATANGAAIYVADAAPFSLIHATLVSPTAPTGATQAIYVQAGTVYLSNTLIATHTHGIGVAGGMASDWNTLFAGVSTPYSGTVTSVGGITGTAGFVNPAADDYHLGAGSAALNAGIDAGVYTDFDGQARPQGGGFDIGYDERLPITPRMYLPMVVR